MIITTTITLENSPLMDPVTLDYLIQCDPVPPFGSEASRVAIVAKLIGCIEFMFEAVILEEVQAPV